MMKSTFVLPFNTLFYRIKSWRFFVIESCSWSLPFFFTQLGQVFMTLNIFLNTILGITSMSILNFKGKKYMMGDIYVCQTCVYLCMA